MTATIACLLLGLWAPEIQDPDRDLAVELVERGWTDLAEDLTRKERSTIAQDPYILGLIAAARAREEGSVDRALSLLEGAIARFAKTSRALRPQERSLLGALHVQKARLLSESPAGSQAWKDAEAYYRTTIAEFARRPAAADVDEVLLDFRLELPRVLLARARVPSERAVRPALLDEAVRLLQDYQFDTGDRLVVYEALLEEGRVRLETKDYVRAERCFAGILELKKKGALKPYLAALWDAAFLGRVQTLALAGKAKEAVAVCERFFRDEAARAGTPMGLSVMLAQADALKESGDEAKAFALAQKVVGLDPGGPQGRAARERIRGWMRAGTATPDRLLLAAEGLLEQGRFRDALVDLRRCVEVCSGPAEREKFEPVASFKRGECFRELKQEAEAAVAFQDVFRKYPKHDLASRAAFEAVRALTAIATATRDAGDQERQERLLKELGTLGLHGALFKFLEAQNLERREQWKAAADLYAAVDEGSGFYHDALVTGAHCYYRDAMTRGGKGKEDASRSLALAEEMLRRALGRLEAPADARLLVPAEFELALICLEPSVKKPKDALTYAGRCAKRVPAGQDLQARLIELVVRAQLELEDLAAATSELNRLVREYPEHPATARSARRLALRQEAKDPAAALKSYRLWLDCKESGGGASPQEELSVADAVYRLARTLNRFDEGVVSVLDLRGKPVPDQAAWREAARALGRLQTLAELSGKDRPLAATRLAWSLGLAAQSAEDWDRLKRHGDALISKYALLTKTGQLDSAVLQKERWLAGIYLEYGNALLNLGRSGQKFQFVNALTVFNNLRGVTEPGSEPWWIARLLSIRALFERGEGDDIPGAEAVLSSLERSNPDFDGGKYGVKPLLLQLKDELKQVRTPRR